MRRALRGLLGGWVVTSLTLAAPAEPISTIDIVLSREGDAYRALDESLRNRLQAALGEAIHVQTSVLPTLALSNTLIVSVGTQASMAVLNRHPTVPVIATLIPRQAVVKTIERETSVHRAPVTAIYLDQPLSRYLELIKLMLPEAKRIGMVYGPVSGESLTSLREAVAQAGWALQTAELTPEGNIVRVLEPLLKEVDVLLALPDPLVFSDQNIQPFLLASYRKGVPVIGFSEAYVNAGALAAVYSTPAQLADQAVDIILDLLRQPSRQGLPRPQYPRYFSIRVNRHVAKSLGLNIPAEAELQRGVLARETGKQP